MRCFVFFRSGISGGTGTFAIRAAGHLSRAYDRVFYVLEEYNDEANRKSLSELGVRLIGHSSVKEEIAEESELTIMTYTIQEYAKAASVFKKYKNKIILLYPLSNSLTGDDYTNNKILNKLSYLFTRPYFKRLYDSKCIIFTGSKFHKKYAERFKLESETARTYLTIPIDVGEFEEERAKSRFETHPRTVVSVLRTDFPLKGYVFGLIEDMGRLWDEGHDLKLLLIASGDGLQKIKDALNKAGHPENTELVEGCGYGELKTYIDGCFLNVGHGTSILDASSLGVPSLVAADMTCSDKTGGAYRDTKRITLHEGTANLTLYECIKEIEAYDKSAYLELAKSEYDITREKFSMDSFCKNLSAIEKELQGKKLRFSDPGYAVKLKADKIIAALHQK